MVRIKQMMIAARSGAKRDVRAVPLVVPHGTGDAGRDFESAFELLQGDERARKLWYRAGAKIPVTRAS